jgi:hypothetical protein
MNVAFPPPQHWQDFENLTVEVFRAVFDDPGAQGHGRSGQAQYGVDVCLVSRICGSVLAQVSRQADDIVR